mmetsp:Transcript_10127/g.41993  ORF Transcript_10127/g.41993 Transcript_10127/m.41993 type:complete len:201 (-) Transcript_10127:1856-2458(-)
MAESLPLLAIDFPGSASCSCTIALPLWMKYIESPRSPRLTTTSPGSIVSSASSAKSSSQSCGWCCMNGHSRKSWATPRVRKRVLAWRVVAVRLIARSVSGKFAMTWLKSSSLSTSTCTPLSPARTSALRLLWVSMSAPSPKKSPNLRRTTPLREAPPRSWARAPELRTDASSGIVAGAERRELRKVLPALLGRRTSAVPS